MTSWNEILLEVEGYMQRYRDALGEIANCGDQANAVYLREVARTALDGEPTTADEFNKVQDYGPPYSMANPSGESVKDSPLGAGFAHKDTKIEKDYNYECEHLNATYQAEELDTNVPESYTCDDCNKDLNIPEPDWDSMREGK